MLLTHADVSHLLMPIYLVASLDFASRTCVPIMHRGKSQGTPELQQNVELNITQVPGCPLEKRLKSYAVVRAERLTFARTNIHTNLRTV